MMNLQTMFLREKSFEGYDDRSVLECLLTTAGVRGDVPALIDKLFDGFGGLKGILEARPDQLMMIPGMREKPAALISMVTPLARVWEKCNMREPDRITNRHEAEAFCKAHLMGERNERFYVIAVNAQCKVLGTRKISEGSLGEVSAYPRLVAETALNYNAHSVFFCHNHPGGTCAPFHSDLQPDKKAESIIDNYVKSSGVTLKRIQSDKAYYSPSTDTIVVPEINQYSDVAEFYSTLFHESVHSTGHHTRLNRITDVARYGSESYSKEELIAELGASYLVNTAGIETDSSFRNSAAYVNGWLAALKNDKRFIVSAAGQAEKAVQLILAEEFG